MENIIYLLSKTWDRLNQTQKDVLYAIQCDYIMIDRNIQLITIVKGITKNGASEIFIQTLEKFAAEKNTLDGKWFEFP